MRLAVIVIGLLAPALVHAEVNHHGGADVALPTDKYVHVVSEKISPVERAWVKAKDGVYIAAAIRKPAGRGPFPAIITFHGAPGGRGMDQLVGWSRGDHGGPVWERFLQEGFVVVVADYRGGPFNLVNAPSSDGLATAIDDGISVVDYVRALPAVDPGRVSVYGVSLGGNLVMFLASKVPTLHAVVAGVPAPMWFLGLDLPAGGTRPDFASMKPNPPALHANIAPIRTPILLFVGTADSLMPLDVVLHDALAGEGKTVHLEIYEHGYHDFVLGPQGQKRSDLPRGEILLPGALDALEQAVAFVRNPK